MTRYFFKFILTLIILASFCVPVYFVYRYEVSQWKVFRETWLFVIYPILIFIVGSGILETLWKEDSDES